MTNQETMAPIPEVISISALGYVMGRAVHAVVALGIPDLLSDGPLTVEALADRCQVKPRQLGSVLRAVATTGLLQTRPDGSYALTGSGEFLQTGHPSASRDLLLTVQGELYYNSLGKLLETLRTGVTGPELDTGKSAFAYWSEHEEESQSFGRMLTAYEFGEPEAVAAAYDFSSVGHIVDVGGGIGTLLAAILTAHPSATGTLFDQPAVVSAAKANLAGSAVVDRISFSEGDFFTSVPAGGDLYLLSHIVHDWDDDRCLTILRSVREAMAPGARVIVKESILPENDEPNPAKLLDIIITALFGGSERTETQYAELLTQAGFRIVQVHPAIRALSLLELEAI